MARRRRPLIIRNFQENGVKFLLDDPANVRDLMHLFAADLADVIDFDRMALVKTTFIKNDFRHIASDCFPTLQDSYIM